MGPKRKMMNLQIDCDEVSEMEKSIYSEIGNDGLRFLKQDMKITSEGLTDISGNIISSILPTSKSALLLSDVILGKGAACSVQQGIYKPWGIKVAIKVLMYNDSFQTINAYDRNKRHQIMNDLKILLKNQVEQEKHGYKCDFIITLIGAYYEEGSVKVILELMDIGSLEYIVKIYNLAKVKPQIDEAVLVKIALQMLCGLAYLHSNNQLHRDVKSANVLINSKGEIKLTDFGIAKQIDEDKEFTKTSVGTRSYMSPQRIKGEEYGPKSDIWGFGLIMYELATGEYMFKNSSEFDMIKQFDNGLPGFNLQGYSEDFEDFLMCSLQIQQKHRYSAMELMGHPWVMKNLAAQKTPTIKEFLDHVKKDIVPLIKQEK